MRKSFKLKEEIEREYQKFKKEYPDSNYYHVEAIIAKKFGDILVLEGADTQIILIQYKEAFLNFKKYGESEPYSIHNQLIELDKIFQKNRIPTTTIKSIGEGLCKYWTEYEIDETYPETLHILSFWRDGKIEGS